ncbi:hypothetical protein [Rhizobium sp.]|uniref:hypothetical protein n=1 Tax=Rhizobium sp. TaxID=391 RepID=UPI0039175F6F
MIVRRDAQSDEPRCEERNLCRQLRRADVSGGRVSAALVGAWEASPCIASTSLATSSCSRQRLRSRMPNSARWTTVL